jgi:serine/threonine protein kinase
MPSSGPGRRGPYEILSSLGKGGMGEVWRARDPRLNREVAIKVSAMQFTDRFEREAHAIASLNHPNICTLFDIGPNYLVMELVEGPTLAERIAEGPVPVEEALGIAKQIADALEAAPCLTLFSGHTPAPSSRRSSCRQAVWAGHPANAFSVPADTRAPSYIRRCSAEKWRLPHPALLSSPR